jgi:squalene-hopene/tetraprenyl-beta-curcumene cyclase
MKTKAPKIKRVLQRTLVSVKKRLLSEMNTDGYWEGELSSSALSTAVAVAALARTGRKSHHISIKKGLNWLLENVNPDGGWGDSPGSKSNLSTTLLCWSALSLADGGGEGIEQNQNSILNRAEFWLTIRIGSLEPRAIASAVLSYYGNDRTFSAPILLMCALCGRLGPEKKRWQLVPQLPLELAVLPHGLFKWLRLPVVSYAIPALIAIGLAKHRNLPSRFPVTRFLRNRVTLRVLEVLENIQPEHGGYLEAAPLTGFVVMSLASAGYRQHPVTSRGIGFLLQSQRRDGSWPIDTNLSIWVTTLAVNALLPGEEGEQHLDIPQEQRDIILERLLDCQFKKEHIFTHAAPAGWSWTDLPGGVPDADDTSGALLALRNLGHVDAHTKQAATEGIQWLLDLGNRDGGVPTFCKGWGKLPFDRSCPDITAHALCAFAAWRFDMEPHLQSQIDRAIQKGIRYLASTQRKDGSWVPLWFGNQWSKNNENPIYGTAQVVIALKHRSLSGLPGVEALLKKGCLWLVSAQNPDNGWGSSQDRQSTIEETALALNALAGYDDTYSDAVLNGVMWLFNRINEGDMKPSPIGLYFANLWYFEKMYPIVFTISALKALLSLEFKGLNNSHGSRNVEQFGMECGARNMEQFGMEYSK